MKKDASTVGLGEAFSQAASQALVSRQEQAAQARIDFPDIAATLDDVITSALQSGSTLEEARRDIKWRWAYDRTTGKELGTAPPGALAAALQYWEEIDNEGKTCHEE